MIRMAVTQNEAGQRLDRFLRKYLKNAPLSLVFRMVRKDVKVNGKRKPGDYMLEEGDEIALYLTEEQLDGFRKRGSASRARRTFGIVYEDENILLVNKPKGLLTHGDGKEKKDHLTNQVIDYLIETGAYDPRTEKTFAPAPANRIDRNTSGLVIFAKNYATLKDLNRMIRERGCIRKIYLTVALGVIGGPLSLRDSMVKDEEKNLVTLADEGREMRTEVRPIAVSPDRRTGDAAGLTLCEVEIETGRTHQIRVQLAGAGHPILGDRKYGAGAPAGSASGRSGRAMRDAGADAAKAAVTDAQCRALAKRYGTDSQLLHSYRLVFTRPEGCLGYLAGKAFTADPPAGFRKVLREAFGMKAVPDLRSGAVPGAR